jgi:hypothetical protein
MLLWQRVYPPTVGTVRRGDQAIWPLPRVAAKPCPDVAIARVFAVQLEPSRSACLADSMAAHALDPNSAETGTNIGSALPSLGRCDEALRWFDKALEIRPNLAEELHRFDDAFALYNRMKARKLNNTRTEWILFHLRLLTGNFEAGWAGQEARLKLPSATYPKFPLPIWLGGENIEGKTILICADEGLGDTIQFVRYVPMLVERGARVVLVVQNPLYHLLSELPGILLYFSLKAGSCRRSTCTAQWAACRWPSERVSIRFRRRRRICLPLPRAVCKPGRIAWASYQAPGRPGLVRQSNRHQ